MKFVIVLACLLVVAYANEDNTKVLKNDAEVNVDSFHYALELDNSIKAHQHGELKDKDNWLVHGEYEYISKDGKHHKVTYVADEHGYQPKIEI